MSARQGADNLRDVGSMTKRPRPILLRQLLLELGGDCALKWAGRRRVSRASWEACPHDDWLLWLLGDEALCADQDRIDLCLEEIDDAWEAGTRYDGENIVREHFSWDYVCELLEARK